MNRGLQGKLVRQTTTCEPFQALAQPNLQPLQVRSEFMRKSEGRGEIDFGDCVCSFRRETSQNAPTSGRISPLGEQYYTILNV